jgi:hypothetical protein
MSSHATTRRSPAKPGETRGRRASEKPERYRFAQNVAGEGTVAEHEYEAHALSGVEDPRGEPDVLLDVPVVKVDAIHLELDNLDARVALRAKVLDLVRLNAGVDVHLGKLRIDVTGVEAQALLKVRLDHVAAIVDRVLTTVDRNPELLESLGRTVERVGEGAGHALDETGEAVDEVGQGAGQATRELGHGAGQAAGGLSEGAGAALGEVEEAVPGVRVAKLAARFVAQELKATAAEEAKELGLAVTRKAVGVGERRRQRKAEDVNATQAAMRAAERRGIDLEEIEGTGPEHRITIRDVRKARET